MAPVAAAAAAREWPKVYDAKSWRRAIVVVLAVIVRNQNIDAGVKLVLVRNFRA